MEARMNDEITIVRQGLAGQRTDEAVIASAATLSERLDMLKRRSPLFDAVSLSPDVEAMMAEQVLAVAS